MFRILSAMSLLLLGSSLLAKDTEIPITITGGKIDLKNVVVKVPGGGLKVATTSEVVIEGKKYPAQTLSPSLFAELPETETFFILPTLKAGESLKGVSKSLADTKSATAFAWKDADGKEPTLTTATGLPLLKYIRPEFDPKAIPEKQKANANPTFKVYHHLFAADGKTLLTNGAEGKFPHHRGIFYGFNTISYGKEKADIWHGWKGEHQAHEKVILSEAGPVMGRQRVRIDWIGGDQKTFAIEDRELSVYNTSDGTLIDFLSLLKTDLDLVKLDGDPQHAGFHFRASSEVEKTEKETYFLRPDGKGEKGKELNWDPKTKQGPVNLPWNAMSFLVGGKRYTCLYLDHPSNPKEARQSERAYGRIGTYFEYNLTKEKPLKVQYRLWVQEGEMTVEQCEAMSKAFVEPPKVTLGDVK